MTASSPNGETDMNDIDIVERLRRKEGQCLARPAQDHLRDLIAAAADAIETGWRERGQWERRMWATVYERAAWDHDLGRHDGAEHPYQFCPRCEIEHPKGRLADAIETGRQWETIARRQHPFSGHNVLCRFPTTKYCTCGYDMVDAAFRDVADRTPTPTDDT